MTIYQSHYPHGCVKESKVSVTGLLYTYSPRSKPLLADYLLYFVQTTRSDDPPLRHQLEHFPTNITYITIHNT